MLRRLLFLVRAWWTWHRGIRADAPFCWGCGFIFPDDWYGVSWPLTGVWRTDDPHLCLDCKRLGWRLSVDGSGVYQIGEHLSAHREIARYYGIQHTADRRLDAWQRKHIESQPTT